MTLLWQLARVAAVVGIIVGALYLLPDAPESLDTLTIPDVIWNPLVAVLQLDRYFPISTLLAIAAVGLSIRGGLAALWLWSWLSKHVFGGG